MFPDFQIFQDSFTRLTYTDVIFEWTKECQAIFEILKKALCKQPILKYLDPERPYIVFMDASNYGWAGVLTQPYTDNNDTLVQFHTIKADESNASNSKLMEHLGPSSIMSPM